MLRFLSLLLVLAITLASADVEKTSIKPSPTTSHSMNPSQSNATSTSTFSTIASETSSASVSPSISPSPTSSMPSSSASPTPKPTTKPTSQPTTKPPVDGDYSVKDEDGNYCLLAMLDVSCMVKYEDNENHTSMVTIHMPIKKTMFSTNESVCGANPILSISWPQHKPLYQLKMVFKGLKAKGATNTTTGWEVSQIDFTAKTKNNPQFPNATEENVTVSVTNSTELAGLNVKSEGYYMCAANRTYPSMHGQLFFKYVKLQPFGVKPSNTSEFCGKEFNCETAPTPAPKSKDNNIVPIAVGCALAGLVLIVLIAYIIGRRKSQRGYEKV
ncbi:lysosome-associated membrane glycoprotein 1 [Exaiptasia diaphana]|uniref:Lysosome-associated membrane glycoprotein 2-like transmembrane domain-containing protein n=1 Tax=Exaiptasia diaphana TaxID=2652724 RepID=A0A913WZE3_EXADI|nr:lysosome-associated membrane glycoprotein 1 [Exaiptasia diaphana]